MRVLKDAVEETGISEVCLKYAFVGRADRGNDFSNRLQGILRRRENRSVRGRLWKIAVVLLPVVLALAAGGCGNTALYEEGSDRGQGHTVIRVAWWGGEERGVLTEQVLELYSSKHPEITFETQSYTWDEYFNILSLKAAQGDLPDLIQMDYQYITTYSKNGSLADLLPYVENGTIRTDDLDKGILESGMIDGRLTGIVLGTSVLSMICNPEVFAEAGITVPNGNWTWDDFSEICIQIRERTGKYGAAMNPVLDLNLFHYWVRQHGSELFSPDGRSLGYEEDALYAEYMSMFKELIEKDAFPDADSWAAINVRGPEFSPVVTGEGGMMQEWNNYPVKMSYANDSLKLVTQPLLNAGEGDDAFGGNRTGGRGLWMKPGMFFSVAETSNARTECAQFIDWFLNSEEANAILQGERGVPVSEKVRKSLYEDETVPEALRDMLRFSEEVLELCGDTPPPEPAGIDGINEAFSETANLYFYDLATAEEAAAEFRRRTNEILQSNP